MTPPLGGDAAGVLFPVWAWEEWKSRYGTSPPWGKKEMAQLHEARQRLDTEQLAREAWMAFLTSTDPFYEGHEPGKFLSSLSRWTGRVAKKASKRPNAFPGAARAAAMARIVAEVSRDATIPLDQKRAEMSRRWKELS